MPPRPIHDHQQYGVNKIHADGSQQFEVAGVRTRIWWTWKARPTLPQAQATCCMSTNDYLSWFDRTHSAPGGCAERGVTPGDQEQYDNFDSKLV